MVKLSCMADSLVDGSNYELERLGSQVYNSRQEGATPLIAQLEAVIADFDFNPESNGELSGADAVLEFIHSEEFKAALNAAPRSGGSE